MATPAETKLLPDSLVSALQTLVSVATISLITFGDRTLNAALAGLVTVLFSLTMGELQKYSSWSQVWDACLLSSFSLSSSSSSLSFSPRSIPLLSLFWSQKSEVESKGKGKGKGPTDFNPLHVPKVPHDAVFKHSLFICNATSEADFIKWGCKTFGSHVFLKLPELQRTNYALKTFSTVEAYPVSDVLVNKFGDSYFPIWRSADGSFVYATSKVLGKEWTHATRIVGNNKKDLEDVINAINEFAKKEKAIASLDKKVQPLQIYKFEKDGKRHVMGSLSVHKTFDHLFFDQKEELIDALTRFRDGKMYAEHLGEDNKLGILLYGPPGTGKSACMSAICNFLQRIPSLVTGQQLLKKQIMDAVFKNNTDIIIMDEFDCLLDVIRKREGIMGGSDEGYEETRGGGCGGGVAGAYYSNRSHKYQMAAGYLQMAKDEKDDAKKKELMKKYEDCINEEEDKVDMAYILSKFQGMEAADNRCIVACTNDPARIDDALKRKGRFDLILHLDNASPSIILDMVAHYFQLSADQKQALTEEFADQLPSRVISPASVQDFNASSKDAREALTRMAASQRCALRPCLLAPNSPRQSVSSSGSTGEPA